MVALDDALLHAQERTDRHIHGEGTPETLWRCWAGLGGLHSVDLDHLAPKGRRVVVVSPHPDDEVLGCGGTLARLARADREILVVAVTNGEASHPGSRRWPPERLAERRQGERANGLRALGVTTRAVALNFPDGAVAAHESRLATALADIFDPRDVVLTTWRRDGHPDHEATGRACAIAAARRNCSLWEMPVWMWHWATPGDARVPWSRMRRVQLGSSAVEAKRRAISAHATQLEAIADEARTAILPPWALARLLRSFEAFIPSEGPQ